MRFRLRTNPSASVAYGWEPGLGSFVPGEPPRAGGLMPRGVDSPAQPFGERCRSVSMGLSSRPPGSEVDEGIQPERLSLSRGTEESDGPACTPRRVVTRRPS